jgi:hypothetical protein
MGQAADAVGVAGPSGAAEGSTGAGDIGADDGSGVIGVMSNKRLPANVAQKAAVEAGRAAGFQAAERERLRLQEEKRRREEEAREAEEEARRRARRETEELSLLANNLPRRFRNAAGAGGLLFDPNLVRPTLLGQ